MKPRGRFHGTLGTTLNLPLSFLWQGRNLKQLHSLFFSYAVKNLKEYLNIILYISGVILTCNLSWTPDVERILVETRKFLGMLYRQFYQWTVPEVLTKIYYQLKLKIDSIIGLFSYKNCYDGIALCFNIIISLQIFLWKGGPQLCTRMECTRWSMRGGATCWSSPIWSTLYWALQGKLLSSSFFGELTIKHYSNSIIILGSQGPHYYPKL